MYVVNMWFGEKPLAKGRDYAPGECGWPGPYERDYWLEDGPLTPLFL